MDKKMKDRKMPDKNLVDYPDSVPTRVALLEMSISHINDTLIRLESKMDKGFEQIDRRFAMVYSCMKWMAGLVIALSSGMFAIMAHGFHWL